MCLNDFHAENARLSSLIAPRAALVGCYPGDAANPAIASPRRFHLSPVNHALKIAVAAFLCSAAHAGQDPQAHSSPDRAFTIVNVGDKAQPDHHFEIRARNGRVLLSSATQLPLESGSFASSIRWSADSRFVAFSVRTSGPYIRDTFIYSTRTSELLRVPTDDDDYQTAPVRWHDARTLIVQTRSPVGGKATEGRSYYQYRRTIRLSEPPLRQDTLYTSKRTRLTQ